MSDWQEKISLQDLNFKKVKLYLFTVRDEEDRPVIVIDDNDGHGYCFTRKNLKTLLATLDRDYPKERKGNTAYGAFEGDSDGKSYDDPFKFTTMMECCGKDADKCTCRPKTKFIPDEPKRKVCYPECGCNC